MDLSIVIPVFEESRKIARDVKEAANFLSSHQLESEIIIVDDGSRDGTSETAKNIEIPQGVKLEVIRYEQHHGKGYAVRTGVSQSKGDYVMFADSGCCVPYQNAFAGLDLIKNGSCDIAHGSRKMSGSHIEKAQTFYRRICSKIFHWFVVHDLKIPVEFTDTQCGFKIYKGDVARLLYSECVTDGFMFDIEVIIRALKKGYKIREFPIDWTCDPDSRLSPSRSSWKILAEIFNIRRTMSKE
jgi:dolichyl-phosphate beta-glucosyltransferase